MASLLAAVTSRASPARGDDFALPSAAGAGETSESRDELTWRVVAVVVAILAVHATLAWQLRIWGITSEEDDAGYVLLSRALRSFQYRELHDATLPIAAKYPPGYPALLALVSAVAGERLGPLLFVSVVSSLVALWCLFDVAWRQWSLPLAIVAVTLAAINPYLIANAGRLKSEAPFTAFVMLTLWAARDPNARRFAALAGAAAIGAALTRSVGATVIVALGLHWLLARQYRRVFVFGLASAVTAGTWNVWTFVAPAAKERALYVAEAVAFVDTAQAPGAVFRNRVASNVVTYAARSLPYELSLPTIAGTSVDNVMGAVAIAILLLVALPRFWRGWRLAVIFAATYAAVLSLWAWAIDRFVDPVLPLVILMLVVGAYTIGRRVGPRAATVATLGFATIVGGTAIGVLVDRLGDRQQCDRERPFTSGCITASEQAFFAAARYVAAATPASAVVVTPKPRPFYYYSGRRTLTPRYVRSFAPDSLVPRLRQAGAEFVLLSDLGFEVRAYKAVIAKNCDAFTVDRQFAPETALLRLSPPGGSDTNASACRLLGVEPRRPEVPSGTGS